MRVFKRVVIGGLVLFQAALFCIEPIPVNAKVYVNEMNGFGTYFVAALNKKKVPVTVVADKSAADYEILGDSDSQKAGWAKTIFMGQTGSREEASINVINLKTGTVAFAYAVNKSNSARGKQSSAEACAKHLKEAMFKK